MDAEERRKGEKMSMYQIMIVEDDDVIASAMKNCLESWNYQVRLTKNFENVMGEFFRYSPDLVLLDITLPYLNGYHWCEEIRKVSKVPILFISSASDNMNIVMAMSMGADDFVTKPFDLTVLAAKIQAILRRSYDFSGKTEVLEYRGVRFFPAEGSVSFQEKKLELTKNEIKIMRILMEHPGEIVERDMLMEYLWKTDSYVDENTLSVNVNRLRKKLESIGVKEFIHTKKGIGYRI